MRDRPDPHKLPQLPPGFAARLTEAPWAAALAAATPERAGDLFHADAGGLLEAALILAPERPVGDETVLRLATLAMRDALLALVPPETSVAIVAAGAVAVNQGEVARLRLARGPDWLVLGLLVRLDLRLAAPGRTPWLTDLAEEGVDVGATALLESICRHLLAAIDLWQTEGEAGIAREWRSAGAMAPA